LGAPRVPGAFGSWKRRRSEGAQAFLSHKEAGKLLRALSEALEALFGEEE
jgi:hypothetical protein